MQKMPNVGLYGADMHDFILTEAELGTRVAECIGQEPDSFVADAHHRDYVQAEQQAQGRAPEAGA